jgi:hypothetical protein
VPDDFTPERLRSLYLLLKALPDQSTREQALSDALKPLSREVRADVLSQLIIADGTIAELVDSRPSGIPVTFGRELENFRRNERRERERRQLVEAIVQGVSSAIETARASGDVTGINEESVAGRTQPGPDANERPSPIVSDGTTLSSDVRLAKSLISRHGGDTHSARKEFVARVAERDSITPKSARARFKKALDELTQLSAAERG